MPGWHIPSRRTRRTRHRNPVDHLAPAPNRGPSPPTCAATPTPAQPTALQPDPRDPHQDHRSTAQPRDQLLKHQPPGTSASRTPNLLADTRARPPGPPEPQRAGANSRDQLAFPLLQANLHCINTSAAPHVHRHWLSYEKPGRHGTAGSAANQRESTMTATIRRARHATPRTVTSMPTLRIGVPSIFSDAGA